MDTLLKNVTYIDEGAQKTGHIYIKENSIHKIYSLSEELPENINTINASGKILLPGAIDDQVHFRDPGLTHKGDIQSESKAAAAGGITSYMEMPNTKPQTTNIEALEQKYRTASDSSYVNYSFYMGATNDNFSEIEKLDPKKVCGLKVFMGSSTGNMLVDNKNTLTQIFKESPVLIATHCEDEATIKRNTQIHIDKYGDQIPISAHPIIRDTEACYKSSSMAADLASKYGSQLHILHLSTEKEISLFNNKIPLKDKKITGEVCVHHIWFDDRDYEKFGARIKWNPAVKSEKDKIALLEALKNDTLDVIATDHAPHLWNEKSGLYLQAASGGPLVQHSLLAMLDMVKDGKITIEKVVEKMCHAPADLYRIKKRGYIKEGYFADLVLVDLSKTFKVEKDNILYKCKWSPFEGHEFSSSVTHTFVNGKLVYENGKFHDEIRGERLEFDR